MVQSGERILFAADSRQGEVEVHVSISYQGAAEDFAWVVPVVSEPELGVGTNETFRQLENATAPQFVVKYGSDGSCGETYPPYAYDDADVAAGAEGERDVEVVSRQEVGPYDAVVLRGGDAGELVDWLTANDYRVDPSTETIIGSYVDEGQLFVALKLLRDQEVGDIQPLVMRFAEARPCIPLRLTAIAAIADMPVRAWLLGPARGIPLNYHHVRVNWSAVDWLNYGFNYQDVVRRAADEAMGNAFVTEYAGAASIMDGRLWTDGRFDTARLRRQTDPAAFMQELINQGWPADAQMLAILRRHMPLPHSDTEGCRQGKIDEQSFYNCVECYRHCLEGYRFDPAALVDELEEVIVAPLRAAQALFAAHPKLTRLNTYISPEEMTLDPILSFNADLPDVSNVHTATATLYCGEDGTWGTAPLVFDLPDGDRVVLNPTPDRWYQWPGSTIGNPGGGEADAVPAADVIEMLEESGTGRILTDADPKIDPLPYDPSDPTGAGGDGDSGCACTLGGQAAAPAWLALLAPALALLRRRRPRA